MGFIKGEKINLAIGKKTVSVKVMEINRETGMPSKMKAIRRSEKLGKLGFIQEGQDWVKTNIKSPEINPHKIPLSPTY